MLNGGGNIVSDRLRCAPSVNARVRKRKPAVYTFTNVSGLGLKVMPAKESGVLSRIDPVV